MSQRTRLLALAAIVATLAPLTAWSAPIPSRAAEPQDGRTADLAVVQDVLARDQVATVLAARGLTTEQIEARLSRLSDADLSALADDLQQVQAGGTMDRDTMWIVIYILAGVLLIVLLA